MIALGCDHGGFELKEQIAEFLCKKGLKFMDVYGHKKKVVDYPDMALAVCELIMHNKCQSGILLCNTGIGMSIAANKFCGIRAALVYDVFSAQMAKKHNDAQIICIGAQIVKCDKAIQMVSSWLEAEFEGGRHQMRIDKIEGDGFDEYTCESEKCEG